MPIAARGGAARRRAAARSTSAAATAAASACLSDRRFALRRCGFARRPGNLRFGIGSGESGATAAASSRQAVAGAAVGVAVLFVAVDEVGDLVVYGDVVHLRDGKLHARPGAPAIDGDADAAVVGDYHAVAVGGVDPHIVVVAAGRGDGGEGTAA